MTSHARVSKATIYRWWPDKEALARGLPARRLGRRLLTARRAAHRGVLLRDTAGIEPLLLIAALAITGTSPASLEPGRGAPHRRPCGLRDGTAVRRLAVPGLTTTVLTMTLTGIAADVRSSNRNTLGRRLAAVSAMLIGGLSGAVVALKTSAAAALAAASLLVAVIFASAAPASRSPAT